MFSIGHAYDLFGLRKEATLEDLEASFRRLARKYHPDKHQGSPEAEKIFAQIVDAYVRLKRVIPPKGSHKRWHQPQRLHYEQAAPDIRTHIDTPVIPEGFATPENVSVKISFEEAVCGTSKTVVLRSGKLLGPTKTLKVHVPRLTRNGTKLRLRQAGFVPLPGAPPTDVFVVVRVANDFRFSANGTDLYVQVETPHSTASSGGRLKVPTPYGPYWVTIPPLIDLDTIIRFPGLGLRPHVIHGVPGDLYVRPIKRPGLFNRVRDRLGRWAGRRRENEYLRDMDPFVRMPIERR